MQCAADGWRFYWVLDGFNRSFYKHPKMAQKMINLN